MAEETRHARRPGLAPEAQKREAGSKADFREIRIQGAVT